MLAFLSFSYFFDPSPVVPPQAVNSAAFSPDDQLQLGDCGFNGHNNGYTSSMWMDIYTIYILYIYILYIYYTIYIYYIYIHYIYILYIYILYIYTIYILYIYYIYTIYIYTLYIYYIYIYM